MQKEFESLFKKIFNPIIIRVKESWPKSLFFLGFIYVVVVPFLNYIQRLVVEFPYDETLVSIVNFVRSNFRVFDYVVTIFIIFISGALVYLAGQLKKTRVIKEKFDKNLNRWSIPTKSAWTIQECEDKPGKMLSVTNSREPGTLKEIYGWFDYEITLLFKMKAIKKNKKGASFSILVRSENNSNGILLQLNTEKFKQFILHDGVYIQDGNGSRLPSVLETDKWYPVKISVFGDNIDVRVAGYKLQQYAIRTKTFTVEKSVFKRQERKGEAIMLERIISSDQKIKKALDKWIRLYRNKNEKGKTKEEKAWEKYSKIDSSQLTFEYQKGTVGFRAIDEQQTFIKDLIVNKT